MLLKEYNLSLSCTTNYGSFHFICKNMSANLNFQHLLALKWNNEIYWKTNITEVLPWSISVCI